MKQILALLATALMAVACFNGGEVKINGKSNAEIKNLGGAVVVMHDQFGNTAEPMTVSSDGTFSGKIKADKTKGYTVDIEFDGKTIYKNIGILIAEPGELTMDFSTGRFYVEGGKLNKAFYHAGKDWIRIESDAADRNIEYSKLKGTQAQEYLITKNQLLLDDIYNTIYSKNTKNFIGEYYLNQAIEDGYITNLSELDKFYKKGGSNIKSAPLISKAYHRMTAFEEYSEGKQYFDISGKDENGTNIRLSDYVGNEKYTLLSFWGNSYKKSLAEFGVLSTMHQQLDESKLQIICCTDTHDSSLFEKYNITYKQIFVESLDDALESYGFSSAPYSVLISPDGTIISRSDATKSMIKSFIDASTSVN